MRKKSVVNLVHDRVYGRSRDPASLIGLKSYKRWQSLALDSTCELERVNASAVNCLETERISGRYMLTGYNEGLVTIHDIAEVLYRKGAMLKSARLISNSPGLHTGKTHKKSVTGVHWYPHDTGLFTSSGMDGNLFVWDTQRMQVADTFIFPSSSTHTRRIYSHSISQNCLIAVGGSPPEICLWSVKTGAVTNVLRGHEHRVSAVEWSPVCSELLVSTGDNGKVFLWDIRQPKESVFQFDSLNRSSMVKDKRAHSYPRVPMLRFLACGSRFVTCCVGGDIRVWNALRGVKERQVFAVELIESDFCKQLTLTPYMDNTQILYVPCKASICMFDINTGSRLGSLQGHFNRVNVCETHSSQELLYSGGNDGEVIFWKPSEDVVGGQKRVPIADNVDYWSDSDASL